MSILGVPVLENRYPVTMDMWPVEHKAFNRIHRFYEHLKEGRLTTTRCKSCSHTAFPPRVICPECLGEDLEWIDLPKEGKVLVFTEQVKGVPLGFQAPLIHAWIDLGPQSPIPRLLSRIINCEAGRLKEGDEVRLVVFEVPSHPIEIKKETITAERVYYAFEPKG